MNEKDDEFAIIDLNGTAKVVLIAVERSIGAWGMLLQQLIHSEDEIFDFIKELLVVQKAIKSLLPDAENFIRPGLVE